MTPKFTPANTFTGPGTTYDTTYPAFGLTVYKQYESQLGRDVALEEHLCFENGSYIEMCAGAHYYAHGAYNASYQKARATVNLSDILLNTVNGRRVGCISLNVSGNGTIDMGVENADDGTWFAFYYSHSEKASGNRIYAPANTTSVTITVEARREGNQDVVVGTFAWSGGTTDQHTFETAAGNLFSVDSAGNPIVRYCRFMSLIPNDSLGRTISADSADGSYMKNAKFLSPQLLQRGNNTWVTWGTSKLDYIWSVQGWNISQCSVGNSDLFGVTHDHYVYNR